MTGLLLTLYSRILASAEVSTQVQQVTLALTQTPPYSRDNQGLF